MAAGGGGWRGFFMVATGWTMMAAGVAGGMSIIFGMNPPLGLSDGGLVGAGATLAGVGTALTVSGGG